MPLTIYNVWALPVLFVASACYTYASLLAVQYLVRVYRYLNRKGE